jgi:hypothetical protein
MKKVQKPVFLQPLSMWLPHIIGEDEPWIFWHFLSNRARFNEDNAPWKEWIYFSMWLFEKECTITNFLAWKEKHRSKGTKRSDLLLGLPTRRTGISKIHNSSSGTDSNG